LKIALLAMVLALLVVAALTPMVRVLALRLGAVSAPGGRHVHQRSIPRLGGLAIGVGFFAAIAALYLIEPAATALFRAVPLRVLGLLVGGAAMCAVGMIDDTRGIRASRKLLLQLAVAAFAFACGFRIVGVHVPLLGNLDTAPVALPLTMLWIVGIINAINLIDGLDGLAAGVVFFAAATNFVVAWLSGSLIVAVLSATIAGSVLGFLFYNFNPARIFMGDSGSYFLGYMLAVTALFGTPQKASTAVSLLVPIIALGVPIFDTLFAMVRRILERRSVFSPDRGHIHHRLLDMGLTHRRAVMIIYAVCGVFTAAAIGVSLESAWPVGVALCAGSIALIGLVRFVGYFDDFHLRFRQRARIRSRDAELLRRAIPRLPLRFADASSEAELIAELWRFAAEADLRVVELVTGDDERRIHRWPVAGDDGAERDLVRASYPLGRDSVARSVVRFAWRCDFGGVPPQSEILLQIAADLLTQNLGRLHSALTPAGEPQERHVSEPPDLLDIPARPSRV
jgi:UDP-GlcNAc:undecaprenyl-phosphate/decaprenyl-phosphate GlcNAc-1-phosphate transferase